MLEQEGSTAARMRKAVEMRKEGCLLWEIGEALGITRERVRQILKKATTNSPSDSSLPLPKLVVTARALTLLRLPPSMRTGSFKRLMERLNIAPAAKKKGHLYWKTETLLGIELPKCVVCHLPVSLARYMRSTTCSRPCRSRKRYQRVSLPCSRGNSCIRD